MTETLAAVDRAVTTPLSVGDDGAIQSEVMNPEPLSVSTVRFSRARPEQRAVLCELAARCFPDSPRWKGSTSLAHRWMAVALACPSAETWVIESGDVVVGFCVLVIDEPGWATEKRRRGGLSSLIAAAILRPSVIAAAVRNEYRHLSRRSGGSTVEWTESECPRLWIELMGVTPEFRGRCLGARLIEEAAKRARELGRPRIELLVDDGNRAARGLYERCGFVLSHSSRKGCRYSRRVEG